LDQRYFRKQKAKWARGKTRGSPARQSLAQNGRNAGEGPEGKNEKFSAIDFMPAASPNTFNIYIALIVGKNRAASGVGFLADGT